MKAMKTKVRAQAKILDLFVNPALPRVRLTSSPLVNCSKKANFMKPSNTLTYNLIIGGSYLARKNALYQAMRSLPIAGPAKEIFIEPNPLGGPAQLARQALEVIGPYISRDLAEAHATTLRDLWTQVPTFGAPIPLMDQIKWKQPFRYHPIEYLHYVVIDAAFLCFSALREAFPNYEIRIGVNNLDRADSLSQVFVAALVRHEPASVFIGAQSKSTLFAFSSRLRDFECVEVYLGEETDQPVEPYGLPKLANSDNHLIWRRQIPVRLYLARQHGDKSKLISELRDSASMYTIGGYYEAALECLNEAISLNESGHDVQTLFDLWANRFLIAFASRDSTAALEAINNLRELFPRTSVLRHELLTRYYEAMYWLRLVHPSVPDNAIEQLRVALGILPKQHEEFLLEAFLYNALGLAHHQLKQADAAREACNKALAILENCIEDPRVRIECATFLYNIGQVELSQCNYATAIDYMDKVQSIEGDLPYYFGERGRFLLEAEDYSEAQKALEEYLGKALDFSPDLLSDGITINFYVQPEDSSVIPEKTISHLQDDRLVIVMNPSVGIAEGSSRSVTLYLSPSHLKNPLASGRLSFERLVNYVLVRSPNLYPLHAAAVGLGDEMALLVGKRGDGKSTLAYSCVRQGMTFLSDDLVTRLARDNPNDIRGQGRFLYVDPNLSTVYPELKIDQAIFPRWRKLRVDLTRLYASQLRQFGQLAALVILERSERATPLLQTAPPEEVVDSLSHHATLYRKANESSWVEYTLNDIKRLCFELPTFKLKLSPDHEKNASAIRDLLGSA